jgi:hypothetical protein
VEERVVEAVLEDANALRPVSWFSGLFGDGHPLPLPPFAEHNHYAERAEDRQQHADEFHAFWDLPKPVIWLENVERVPEVGGKYDYGGAQT